MFLLREVELVALGHKVDKWRRWDLNLTLSTSRA